MEKVERNEYKIGDYVSYGSSGVCRIESIETRAFDGIHEETYYKLVPADGSSSAYFVPSDRVSERLRSLLSREEVEALIEEMRTNRDVETEWCNDSRERRSMFQDILHSDDYRRLLHMMRSIHQQDERKRSIGKRLANADENALRTAENRMYQEFGIVLGIPADQVHSYILGRFEEEKSDAPVLS